MTSHPVLVEVMRGERVESFHRGSLAVVDADGTLVAALGDIERPVFPRSAVKALQALPLVESGAADRWGLSERQLALACASHGGEPAHVREAAAMLAQAGLDAGALECGAHWPGVEAAARALAREGGEPSALHNNCSGKHAGFLCVGCVLAGSSEPRAFVSGYVGAEHPVMREVSAALEAVTGCRLADAPRATDGCSIPTFGIPLRRLAHGFARFGTGAGFGQARAGAARRLRAAVAGNPFFVGGSGRFDSRVTERLGERVFCKVGAEGVYCAALPQRGLGVAIKIDDGNNARAAEVAMAAAIEALAALADAEAAFVHALSQPVLQNWNGIEVGALRATPALRAALIAAG